LLTRCRRPYRLLGSDSSETCKALLQPQSPAENSWQELTAKSNRSIQDCTRLPESDDRKFFHEAPRVSHRYELWLIPCEPPNGGAGRDCRSKRGSGRRPSSFQGFVQRTRTHLSSRTLSAGGADVAGEDQCGTLYR
jgi:hypothetical protein